MTPSFPFIAFGHSTFTEALLGGIGTILFGAAGPHNRRLIPTPSIKMEITQFISGLFLTMHHGWPHYPFPLSSSQQEGNTPGKLFFSPLGRYEGISRLF